LRVFDDGNKMRPTWKEWLMTAEEMERGLKAYGHPVMRVYIDPGTFPNWCAAHGTSPGREGRKKFVAAAVIERYGNQN
jgi:DNA-binding helix-hairpin-helix protein with protein kinase domain